MSTKSTPDNLFQTKVSIYIAISLDGFIARPDGSLDWLPGSDGSSTSDDATNTFESFMDSVDVIIMGRRTFDFVVQTETWPYIKPVTVLSNSLSSIPPYLKDKDVTVRASSDPRQLVRDHEGRHLYIDGGKTIQSFLAADLVTHLTLFRIPVLIGSGTPLFTGVNHDIQLQHIETKAYASGIVESRYQVVN